jgi:poly-gamma-glutamate biosynthesis protein PgsC/CapC
MEWIAVSIGLGLIVSFLFAEFFGLSVGGMIVPGYLAFSLGQPLTIVATMLAAITTWAVVRGVDRWAILYGRRRVVLTMLVGFAVGSMLRFALMTSTGVPNPPSETDWLGSVTVIGFVIPGLIALWIERAGMLQTISPLLVATCLVRLVLITAGMEMVL